MKSRMIFLLLLILFSCKKEDILPLPILQFSVESDQVTEGKDVTVRLTLDRPAQQNGTVVLSVLGNAKNNENFLTDPPLVNNLLTLRVLKGAQEVQFTVIGVNNGKIDDGKFMVFSIKRIEGFRVGDNLNFTLEILDYNGPPNVNFSVNTGSVSENNIDGIGVEMLLLGTVSAPGSVTVSIASLNAVLGKDYTLDQTISDNKFTLNVIEGSTKVLFKVYPKDNETFNGNLLLDFTVSAVSGIVQKGTDLKFALTIVDDEKQSVVNFTGNAIEINECDGSSATVQLPFSGPALGAGTITILVSPATAKYARDYIITPEPQSNILTLNVLPGETGKSFVIHPVHNYTSNQNQQLLFTITTTDGAVQKGTSLTQSVTIINCEEESLVNFSTNSGELIENNDSGIVIDIPFSAQALGDGSISISFATFHTSYGSGFVTMPAAASNNFITLPFAANASGVQLKVFPVNDVNCQTQGRTIHFTIAFANGAVKKGSNLDYVLTLKDEEEPNIVTFDVNNGSVSESNPSGIIVRLNFSKPAPNGATVTIGNDWNTSQSRLSTNPPAICYNSYYYGYCFYTDPSLSVPSGSTQISFKIIPINNTDNEPDYSTYFTINAYSEIGCLSASPDKYSLIIVDDD